MPRLARLLIFAALLAAGCQTPAAITPAPVTPTLLEVQTTPALRPLRSIMQGCAYQRASLGLTVTERPASALEPSRGLLLRWGAPDQLTGYAAQLGSETLVIVVHPSNPLTHLTRQQIAAIYALETRSWSALGAPGAEIHPWAYNPSDDIQTIFETAIGAVHPAAAGLAPDPDAMRQAVAADPDAVGFLPHRALDGSLKALPISDAENLSQPILALAPVEPTALPREWLACLQQRLTTPP